MNSKEICLRILRAESEREVDEIIASVPEMSDTGNWYPLDQRPSNVNIVHNQSSVPSKALTELLTNASDAVIMKSAGLAGVDASSPTAPQSPQEAVKILFHKELPGAGLAGRLNDIDSDAALRNFARENLIVGVTGEQDKGETCFTIVDNGEGQRAKDFPSTFLSLSNKNKSEIPYVQGKYNMGSSGVLNYCGQKRYKLIVSRRYDGSFPWAWTLVREQPGNLGTPIYEYYAPGEAVQTFDHEAAIYPLKRKDAEVDVEIAREKGTIIKLYNYKIDGRNDFIGIRNGIDQNMVSTTLPVRLMDYRFPRVSRGGRAGFVDERTALGMEAELTRHKTPNSAEDDGTTPGTKITVSTWNDPTIGTIVVEAVLFDDIPTCLKTTRDRVFHHVNGQVQYKQKRGYLSQVVKLPGLMDKAAVIIDASNLNDNAHYKIWSANRENIMDTTEGDIYKGIVESALKDSQELKDWEQQKAAEEVNKVASKAQNDTFQNLLNRVPEIKNLLGLGVALKLPAPNPREKPPYVGLFTPTHLSLNSRSKAQQPLLLEIGERREISFNTDAANDYLSRADSPGKAYVTQLQANNLPIRVSHHLRDGTLLARVQTIGSSVKQGDIIELEARFADPNVVNGQLSDVVTIELVEKRERPKRERKPQPPQPEVALPQSRWMTRDGRKVDNEPTEKWPEGITEHDGGIIRELTADETLHLINLDNVTLQNAIRRLRKASQEQIIAMHRTGMQLAMLAMQKQFKEHCEATDSETREMLSEYEMEIYRLNAQAIAMVMPLLVKTLPDHFRLETAEEE